jgi:hypothetical protein
MYGHQLNCTAQTGTCTLHLTKRCLPVEDCDGPEDAGGGMRVCVKVLSNTGGCHIPEDEDSLDSGGLILLATTHGFEMV